MTVAELIARLTELDPSGLQRVVFAPQENVGADGTDVEEPADPETAWVLRTEHHRTDIRTGRPFSWVEEKWVPPGYMGAEQVVRL